MDRISVDQILVDELSVDWTLVDQISVDELLVDQISVDQISVDELSVDWTLVDWISSACKTVSQEPQQHHNHQPLVSSFLKSYLFWICCCGGVGLN